MPWRTTPSSRAHAFSVISGLAASSSLVVWAKPLIVDHDEQKTVVLRLDRQSPVRPRLSGCSRGHVPVRKLAILDEQGHVDELARFLRAKAHLGPGGRFAVGQAGPSRSDLCPLLRAKSQVTLPSSFLNSRETAGWYPSASIRTRCTQRRLRDHQLVLAVLPFRAPPCGPSRRCSTLPACRLAADHAKTRDGLLRLGVDHPPGDRKRRIQGHHVFRFLRAPAAGRWMLM